MKPLIAAAVAGFSLVAGQAFADDFVPKAKGRWIVDVRATDVAPAHHSAITNAARVPTGLDAKVSNDVIPSLGITYFLTDHIAVEAIAGTSRNTIKAEGPGVNADVQKTRVLPPVISAQYHFMPKSRFSPYVGAGPAIMVFYDRKDLNGFHTKLQNGVGAAAQVGFDYAIKGNWSLNVDMKKIWYQTDAKIDGGALRSKVNLDPWVPSVGVGYRF